MMRRSWVTLIGGLVLALAGYLGFYYVSTAHYHSLENRPEPELAWLQKEFHLGDAEFAKICQMHEAYRSGCAERCELIDEKQEKLRELLASTNTVTPEIEKILTEAAQLRAECQKKMLQHFYEVSRTMPPEQGRRYLAWVQGQTVLCDNHSQMHMHH
jgi:Spy/CpxP family protein refolding chaperone